MTGTITIRVCGTRRCAPRCSCGRASATTCSHELTGAKTGSTCSRPLCDRCARTVAGRVVCRVHAEMIG
jgi:hypothetical protein